MTLTQTRWAGLTFCVFVLAVSFWQVDIVERRASTAYARGYTDAVDSVRAYRSHNDNLADILRAYGVNYDFVLTLRGERDTVTAVVHP